MIRVNVQTAPHPYEVLIENGLLRSAGNYLREFYPESQKLYTVSVPPVRKHWGAVLGAALSEAKLENTWLEMADGERRKVLATVEELASKMARAGADRKAAVVAFGGGVAGDVSGLLASIYMRGVSIVQVPTTLLAQVDSAIGGKTGVNLREGKNLIGTFHQPRVVLIDPTVLTTLPEREFRSGLYEALKYGIIQNARIFDFMEENREKILQRDAIALEWIIAESVRVKAAVVSADERESGLRRILNFGHTVGHALEAETGYRTFLHGEAVAWGMVAAAMIGVGLQMTDARTAQRIIATVLAYAPLPKVLARSKSVVKRLKNDKKTLDGHTHFVVPLEIGKVDVVVDVPERAVLQSIEELRYLSQSG